MPLMIIICFEDFCHHCCKIYNPSVKAQYKLKIVCHLYIRWHQSQHAKEFGSHKMKREISNCPDT